MGKRHHIHSPGHPSPDPTVQWFIVLLLRLATRRNNQIQLPGCNMCLKTLPAFFCINSPEQNAAAFQSPSQFHLCPAMLRLIMVCLRSETRRARQIWPASHLLIMTYHPPKCRVIVDFMLPKTEPPFHPPANSAHAQLPNG